MVHRALPSAYNDGADKIRLLDFDFMTNIPMMLTADG